MLQPFLGKHKLNIDTCCLCFNFFHPW